MTFRTAINVALTIICFVSIESPGIAQDSSTPRVNVAEPSLDVNSVRVQVRPELEFVFPYGVVTQQAQINLGRTRVTTSADFNVPSASISGSIGVRRRFANWEPRLRAYQSSSSEGAVKPRISGGQVEIIPDKRFLDRERGLIADISYHLGHQTILNLETDFRESISSVLVDGSVEENPYSEQFEILSTASIQITSLELADPRRSAEINGRYVRIALAQRFLGSTPQPVALHGRFGTLWNLNPAERIRTEHQISGSTPLVIWTEEDLGPVQMGGYDTLRGYSGDSFSVVRGLLFRNTATWLPLSEFEVGFDTPMIGKDDTIRVRVHNPRVLFALDAAIVQETIAIDSLPQVAAGAGPGLSVTVSADDSVHFDIRAFTVWPLDRLAWPVFYLQGSLFALATK